MKVSEKQRRVKELIKGIRPDFTVLFDNSRRCKRLLASAKCPFKEIKFRRPIWGCTLQGCLECACHEMAHIFQWEMTGKTQHDKEFLEIKNMLIEDYVGADVNVANKSSRIAESEYDIDGETEWDID